MSALTVVLKVPPGQGSQSLSVVFVIFPAANKYWPGSHEVYGVHIAALVVVLNPVVHAAQTRSLLGVSCTITYVPGSQTVYGVHVLSLIGVPGVAT